MAMAAASRTLGGGMFTLRAMGSLEPLMGPKGYRLLLQTGETADGRTHLVDHQHPHDLAMELEEIALADDYFVSRKLYPNVDFYSGIIYRALGIPTNMFTVMFAIGRTPGWIAHWKEMNEDPTTRIGRPRQLYTGSGERDYVAAGSR